MINIKVSRLEGQSTFDKVSIFKLLLTPYMRNKGPVYRSLLPDNRSFCSFFKLCYFFICKTPNQQTTPITIRVVTCCLQEKNM